MRARSTRAEGAWLYWCGSRCAIAYGIQHPADAEMPEPFALGRVPGACAHCCWCGVQVFAAGRNGCAVHGETCPTRDWTAGETGSRFAETLHMLAGDVPPEAWAAADGLRWALDDGADGVELAGAVWAARDSWVKPTG